MRERLLRFLDEGLTLQQTGNGEITSVAPGKNKASNELKELLATAAMLRSELAPPAAPKAFRENARIRLQNRFRAARREGTHQSRSAAAAALGMRSPFSQLLTGASMLIAAATIILMIGFVRPVSVAGDPIDLALRLVDRRPSAALSAALQRTPDRSLAAARFASTTQSTDTMAAGVGEMAAATPHGFGQALAAPPTVAGLEAALHAARPPQRAQMAAVPTTFNAVAESPTRSVSGSPVLPSIELTPEDVHIRSGPRDQSVSPPPRFQPRNANAQFAGPRADSSDENRPWNRPWQRGGQPRRPGRPTG